MKYFYSKSLDIYFRRIGRIQYNGISYIQFVNDRFILFGFAENNI